LYQFPYNYKSTEYNIFSTNLQVQQWWIYFEASIERKTKVISKVHGADVIENMFVIFTLDGRRTAACNFPELTLLMKIAVFWVVAPCSLVEVYQRFRGPCCLHHQGDECAEPRFSGRIPFSLSVSK
jgi:hypothetical protein